MHFLVSQIWRFRFQAYFFRIRILDQTNLILKRPNQLNKLNKIVSKTLIIRGKNDKLSSNIMNNELNKKIKYSVYTEIKNSSHFVMLEKPKTFNKIITNFLF